MSILQSSLRTEASVVKIVNDKGLEKTYLFKERFPGVKGFETGAEIHFTQAISFLEAVVDRELTTYETGLMLSRLNGGGSITIDIVSILITGATEKNFLRFLESLRRVVIGYAIRTRTIFGYDDFVGVEGFYDTEGNQIGPLTDVHGKRFETTPFLDPIDFIGAGLANILRGAARSATELAEERIARYLEKEGAEHAGGMSGPKAAASEFWKAGEVRPRVFAKVDRATMTKMIKNRMKELGIPKKNIGIRGIPGESGEAFTAQGTTRGANVRGVGISVHGSVVEDWAGFPEWNAASIPDRIDATIAHEWMEFNELTHWEAVDLALESKLSISENARKILRVMFKKGLEFTNLGHM